VNGDTSEQSGRSQTRSFYSWLITFVSFICLPNAFAAYSRLYVFGDSLSDLVNNAVIFGAGRDPGSYLSLVTRAQRPSVAFQGNTLPTEPALPGGLHTFFPPQPRWSESTSIRTKVAVGSAPT